MSYGSVALGRRLGAVPPLAFLIRFAPTANHLPISSHHSGISSCPQWWFGLIPETHSDTIVSYWEIPPTHVPHFRFRVDRGRAVSWIFQSVSRPPNEAKSFQTPIRWNVHALFPQVVCGYVFRAGIWNYRGDCFLLQSSRIHSSFVQGHESELFQVRLHFVQPWFILKRKLLRYPCEADQSL